MLYNKFHMILHNLCILVFLGAWEPSAIAQYGGTAGAFSRIGFGARGLALGNAMTAIVNGDISPYYNPALPAFQSGRVVTAAYTIMSLDRSLNFVQYSQRLRGSAAVAIGIINSGVSKIDGRDTDGRPTGYLSTSENLIFGTFAKTFTDWWTIGATFKYYHYSLYENISASALTVDLGFMITVDNNTTIGVTLNDLNVKYQWNTTKLYGDQGSSTIDEFPTLIKVGVARMLFDSMLTASIDYVASTSSTHQLRLGLEWNPQEYFSLRAGCDRIDLQDSYSGAMPTFGFAVRYPMNGWHPAIHYAYGIEPFSPSGIHLIAVTVGF